MSSKEKVLEILENNRGKTISGENIACELNLSRNAVWKVIESLRKDGYQISAVKNRGYSLSPDTNILSVQGIIPHLSKEHYADHLYIFQTLDSTNKKAKEMAINGCQHGTVVLSDTQTAGKGRHGKSFYSPPDSGLYISFILRSASIHVSRITLITAAAAVAVCRAIKSVVGIEPGIKWVNDIFVDNKKICGILTEAVSDLESGEIDWIVIGIGININTSFPDDLTDIAGSLKLSETNSNVRNRLAAELINILISSNDWAENEDVYEEYKSRQIILGKPVTVLESNNTYEALAVDIDKEGHLIVKTKDGHLTALSSGEVSVKKQR
ncbi:MAG: biotin--[acetyl-CoA-carboxylase] ligase [Lachnoclostridium sp.]|jgi:BirA family biotin operon repressor/biotin-[acetyl-CoA-carboxylase] ligase|nr:biotin--[acetyl-CoA-carboxylase] ligase [Lachnoclostridium sp.]